MNIEKNQFQAFEPEMEAKAFIYQQVQELEQDVKNIGDLSVYVEKEEVIREDNQALVDNTYAVTFIVDPENLNLKVRAESKDLFSACMSAKEATRSKLNQILNLSSGQDDRSAQASGSLENKGWLH